MQSVKQHPHAKKIFKLEAAHYQLRQPKTQNPVFHWFFTAAAGHSGYLVIVVKRLWGRVSTLTYTQITSTAFCLVAGSAANVRADRSIAWARSHSAAALWGRAPRRSTQRRRVLLPWRSSLAASSPTCLILVWWWFLFFPPLFLVVVCVGMLRVIFASALWKCVRPLVCVGRQREQLPKSANVKINSRK